MTRDWAVLAGVFAALLGAELAVQFVMGGIQ